ncbi:hypothetical protein [uncultured Selenomonas sp.]|uniref:hypothetical protein n=1 Tax=uncultured Selenomonas sp. TaxID=159275 RepID=UPI0028E26CD4|nr:hypothetical protein [uncultured Selenomonas sp.]
MKVVVTNGYVTVGSILHAAGVELDLPEGTAKNLLMEGVVSLPDMTTPVEEQSGEDTGAEQNDGEDTGAEDTDLAPAELPSVDPAAAAKKMRGKKA